MTETSIESSTQFEHVSDTGLIIARIRGRESLRPDRLFSDPYAFKWAGARGEILARASDRNFLTRRLAKTLQTSVIIRTALIDQMIMDAVQIEGIQTVINLGAGLDARPFRLNLPNSLHWIEIDFPQVIAEKNILTKTEAPRCQLERRGLDLNQKDIRAAFFRSLKELKGPLLVLSEGLLLYLTEAEVTELAHSLKDSGVKRWIADVNSPRTLRVMSRVWSFQLKKHIDFKFGHDQASEYFNDLGWSTRGQMAIFEQAEQMRRQSPLSRFQMLLCRFGTKKMADRLRRSSQIMDLECI